MNFLSKVTILTAASLVAAGAAEHQKKSSDMSQDQLGTPTGYTRNAAQEGLYGQNRLAREVRHELVMLPYYGVFDNLAYRVDGNVVTLLGQVTRPTLKSDAQHVVERIEGVRRVVNN